MLVNTTFCACIPVWNKCEIVKYLSLIWIFTERMSLWDVHTEIVSSGLLLFSEHIWLKLLEHKHDIGDLESNTSHILAFCGYKGLDYEHICCLCIWACAVMWNGFASVIVYFLRKGTCVSRILEMLTHLGLLKESKFYLALLACSFSKCLVRTWTWTSPAITLFSHFTFCIGTWCLVQRNSPTSYLKINIGMLLKVEHPTFNVRADQLIPN